MKYENASLGTLILSVHITKDFAQLGYYIALSEERTSSSKETMPGKVKVKILAGRNLPVMDRSSDTTDAYVEIKLGNITHKTDVFRKSLNPQWNSEWFIFEVSLFLCLFFSFLYFVM